MFLRLAVFLITFRATSAHIDFSEPGACFQREDGLYGLQACGRKFVRCNNETSFHLECDTGLHYDTERHVCDSHKNINLCGKNDTRPELSAYQLQVREPTVWEKEFPLFCIAKDDGWYGSAVCSQKVILYEDERSSTTDCSVGNFYDNRKGICEPVAEIPECNGTVPSDSVSISNLDTRYQTNVRTNHITGPCCMPSSPISVLWKQTVRKLQNLFGFHSS